MSSKKKSKKEKEEKTEKETKSKPTGEDSEEEEIDTKGKKLKLEPGGKLMFDAIAVQEKGKPKQAQYFVEVYLGDKKVHKTGFSELKNDKWVFSDPPTYINIPEKTDGIKVILRENTVVSEKYKGEVRKDMESLYDGYPYDQPFPLQNKEGKDDSKIKGALHLKLLYLGKGKEPKHDEFKYPLHSLIHANRLDLFKRKLDELAYTTFPDDDKKLTPLLLASKDGKIAFVKLLVEAGAKIMQEKDPEQRNAIHLAAYHGHPNVINYLARQKGVDLEVADGIGLSALHLAGEQNQGEACTMLVKRGANINATDAKGNTALIHALLVQTGASTAVKALASLNPDIYQKNKDGLGAWEISQRKDLCYSSTNRSAFMEATDVQDAREYEIAATLPFKKRYSGKNLSTEWQSATQFILTAKKEVSVTVLAYSSTKTNDSPKQVGFCVVKTSDKKHKMPSFQQEGIGFGALKPFQFNIEPECAYTIVSYCTKDEIHGDFSVCVFTKSQEKIDCAEAIDWQNDAHEKGSWKGKSAGGSADLHKTNPHFFLTVGKNDKDSEIQVLLMLQQVQKDISNIFAEGGHRIVPTKFYVGFFLYDEEGVNVITKTPHWVNSFDVYMFLNLKPGTYMVIPSTRKEGEQMDFELHVYSDKHVSLKKANN